MADEEASRALERARAIRGGHRGVVTKLVREAEEIITAATESLEASVRNKLNVIRQQLEGKLNTLDGMNKDILERCDPGAIVTEIEEADAIVTKVISCKLKIDELLAATSSVRTSTAPVPPTTIPVATSKPRLPKLTLPKFNGDVTRWTTFWDSFKSAVDENPQLSKIDKFNYLYSLLEGSAFRCVKGLPLSEENYDTALDLLKQRFGKKLQIVCAHMDEIVKLPKCVNDRPHSLRTLYDQITVHIRGLEALEINSDQYGIMMIPIVMSKLPEEVSLRIAREIEDEVWNIGDVMKVVQSEVEAREATVNTKLKTTTSSVHVKQDHGGHSRTIGAFVSQSQRIRCVYCNAPHYSASCEKVRDVKERKDILIKTGRCFNCLKANHKTRECLNTKTCRLCHQRHHQSICGSLSQKIESFIPSTLPPTSSNEEPVVETSNNTSSTKNTETILLQTARAVASNKDTGFSFKVRILFDSGSQRSYVTEHLCSKLKLKPIRTEKLQVNTFGGEHFKTRSCKLVRFELSKPGLTEHLSVTAISFPTICSTLPLATVTREYNHLSGLELADYSGEVDAGVIDILIGSDFYWKFVTGELRRGDVGPVAIYSKLGWLLSGSVSHSQVAGDTFTNLILTDSTVASIPEVEDPVQDMLRKFWDTESIGIVDTEPEATKEFLNHIQFHDNHYEVSLPWKEGQFNLPNHFDISLNRLKHLHTKLLRDPELLGEYHRII